MRCGEYKEFTCKSVFDGAVLQSWAQWRIHYRCVVSDFIVGANGVIVIRILVEVVVEGVFTMSKLEMVLWEDCEKMGAGL